MKRKSWRGLLVWSAAVALASSIGACETSSGGGGGSDTAGTDTNGTDATDTSGGSDGLVLDTGGTDTGSTDTGSTDTGGTDTGSTDTGGTDTGSTDTGGTDSGGGDTGETDAGGSDTVGDATDLDAGNDAGNDATDAGGGPDANDGFIGDVPALLITEIMYDPAVTTDEFGEWFELYNGDTVAVDLRGITIGDSGAEHTISGDSPIMVPPSGFAVIARNGDSAKNGGLTATYSYNGAFGLGNSADSVLIRAGNVLIDRVDYDEEDGWPAGSGQSIQLSNTSFDPIDNDNGGAWCTSEATYGAGDKGTPGALNIGCSSGGEDGGATDTGGPDVSGDAPAFVITEIMYDPSFVSDTDGEWVEIRNVGGAPADLNGLTIGDSGALHTFNLGAPHLIAPGDYALLARKGDAAINGGLTPAGVWAGFGLENTADTVRLLWGDTEIDRVDYDENAGFPKATGASIQLDADFDYASDNNLAEAWCLASVTYGAGSDKGTPGAHNSSCPVDPGEDGGTTDVGTDTGGTIDPSGLVITEIMFDPTDASDSAGEWVEVYNTGSDAIDLTLLTAADSSNTSPLSATGDATVEPGDWALLGRNENPAANGGVNVIATFTFGLNQGSDSFVLLYKGVEIDRVDYNTSAGWPGGAGVAMQLDGSADLSSIDNNVPTSWCAATSTYGGADLGTPGGANASCGTVAPTGCEGICGEFNAADDCYCDAECVASGDCCDDACDTCGFCDGPDPDSCAGLCGGQGSGNCFCDEECLVNGDCCADSCGECGLCAGSPGCAGFCGEESPDGCYCDQSCLTFGDCCDNACTECGVCP